MLLQQFDLHAEFTHNEVKINLRFQHYFALLKNCINGEEESAENQLFLEGLRLYI